MIFSKLFDIDLSVNESSEPSDYHLTYRTDKSFGSHQSSKPSKISFRTVGRFDQNDQFIFKSNDEILLLHKYYALLSTQRFNYVMATASADKYDRSMIQLSQFKNEAKQPGETVKYFGQRFYKEYRSKSISKRTKSIGRSTSKLLFIDL